MDNINFHWDYSGLLRKMGQKSQFFVVERERLKRIYLCNIKFQENQAL